MVLGFPSNSFGMEPGTDKEIKEFYEENYGVTFPLFAKVELKGQGSSHLYKHL